MVATGRPEWLTIGTEFLSIVMFLTDGIVIVLGGRLRLLLCYCPQIVLIYRNSPWVCPIAIVAGAICVGSTLLITQFYRGRVRGWHQEAAAERDPKHRGI